MTDDSSPTFLRSLPLYLACYALWIGLSALGAWLLFQTRSAMFALAIALRFNPWVVRAIDQFGVVTLGLIWLVGILVMEYYLRQGVVKHRLWSRAARVLLFEAVALGLSYGLQALFA
jgi:hypothetical protein